MSLFADRKKETGKKNRGKEKERNAWMILKKKITEGQLAACYAIVNRQLSSIQAENPVALQQHMLSVFIVCISTEIRLHFSFLNYIFKF